MPRAQRRSTRHCAPVRAAVPQAVPQLGIAVWHDPPEAGVRVSGDVDQDSAPELRAAVDKLLTDRPTRLHLDMSEVRFADSCALHLLITTRHRLHEWDGDLALCASRHVARLLEITETAPLFTLTPTTPRNGAAQ